MGEGVFGTVHCACMHACHACKLKWNLLLKKCVQGFYGLWAGPEKLSTWYSDSFKTMKLLKTENGRIRFLDVSCDYKN
jgi:hypothetical protein